MLNKNLLASFQALKDVYSEDAFSNLALNKAISDHRDCEPAFVRAMVKGVLRNSILLDYYIDGLASKGIKKIKNRTLILLRMGIFAIEEMNSMPEYAAVNEVVTLARKVSGGTAGFINAVLRNYLRKRKSLYTDTWKNPVTGKKSREENLSVRYSYAPELVNLFIEQYGYDEAEKIMAAMNDGQPLVIRTNSLRITREALMEKLEEEGCRCSEADGTRLGIVVNEGSPLGTSLFGEGLFSVQGKSSMTAVQHLADLSGQAAAFGEENDFSNKNPQATELKYLDLCSAPGGKTCELAELTGDIHEILACDIYSHRLELVNSNVKRLGIKGIRTEIHDGTEKVEEWENSFQLVVADVPCSGLGTIGAKPEIKLRFDEEEIRDLPEIQKKILANAFSYVKPGGYLMYSTCTLNKDENDGVINWFLQWRKKAGDVETIEKCLLLPYNITTGFYWCIMRKKQEAPENK